MPWGLLIGGEELANITLAHSQVCRQEVEFDMAGCGFAVQTCSGLARWPTAPMATGRGSRAGIWTRDGILK